MPQPCQKVNFSKWQNLEIYLEGCNVLVCPIDETASGWQQRNLAIPLSLYCAFRLGQRDKVRKGEKLIAVQFLNRDLQPIRSSECLSAILLISSL
jgi:hypothetical protein